MLIVNNLIDQLEKINDKDKKIKLSVNDIILSGFYVIDSPGKILLSSHGESNYTVNSVNDLIEQLNKLKDIDKEIFIFVYDNIVSDFYLRESPVSVFLSNYGESSYKTNNIF